MTAHIALETISKPMAVLDRKSLAYAVTIAAMTVERLNEGGGAVTVYNCARALMEHMKIEDNSP